MNLNFIFSANTPRPVLACVFTGLLSIAAATSANAREYIQNPGFEQGATGWDVYIPEDSNPAEVEISKKDAHSGRACAIFKGKTEVRASLCPKTGAVALKPGKYVLSGWVKAGPDYAPGRKPGFIISISMLNEKRELITEVGAIYANWKGESDISVQTIKNIGSSLPNRWTKFEVPFETVEGVSFARVGFFLWQTKGSFMLDDVSLTEAK